MMVGIATETIPFGAHVLCRGFRVSLAAPEIANGTARARPLYRGDKPVYSVGGHVTVDPIEGLGDRDLHALANAPIMDPCRLYLPAGKLSMAETRAREAANLEQPS
jgi:hypothetical protein